MGDTAKASRSQALLNSIRDLIALERDVSEAVGSISPNTPAPVMVPVSPIAFMHGTIDGGNVMVDLGQEYYVERTPRQTRCILERRIAGLTQQAEGVEKGSLLMPREKAEGWINCDTKSQRRPLQKRAHKSGSWTKGFLTAAASDPLDRRSASDGVDVTGVSKTARKQSRYPEAKSFVQAEEVKREALSSVEEIVEVAGADDRPIVEIREWLDASGKQTSVDVTDLGKVKRKIPNDTGIVPLSGGLIADRKTGLGTDVQVESRSSDAEHEAVARDSSDLENVFARLEEKEAAAEESKQAASSLLGQQWKRGFLAVPSKPTTRKGTAAVATGANGHDRTTAAEIAVPQEEMEAASTGAASCSFQGAVIETRGDYQMDRALLPTASAGYAAPVPMTAPRRVSRFKSRRQELCSQEPPSHSAKIPDRKLGPEKAGNAIEHRPKVYSKAH